MIPAQVALGVNATPELLAKTRAEFGIDRPLVTQYFDWIGGVLHGDFGRSYVTRDTIGPQLLDRLGVTLWLVGAGMLVALVIAIPAGHVRRGEAPEGSAARSFPGCRRSASRSPRSSPGSSWCRSSRCSCAGCRPAAGRRRTRTPASSSRGLVLPALSLGLVQGAVLTRYVRSAVLDTLGQDYLRTARSKGLRPGQALMRHGLRNAAVPVVTVLGLQLATLLIGAVVVERVFVLPGLGSMLLDAVAARDLLTVQGIVLVLVVGVLLVNFVVDVLYTVLDPRLRGS